MTTQRKRLQEPKGKCAPCSVFATLGFPGMNLRLAQDAGAWRLGTGDKQLLARSVGQTWPCGGGGNALLWAAGPSCLLQSNTLSCHTETQLLPF